MIAPIAGCKSGFEFFNGTSVQDCDVVSWFNHIQRFDEDLWLVEAWERMENGGLSITRGVPFWRWREQWAYREMFRKYETAR